MKIINSKKNRIFVEAKKLKEKKYRDRTSLCLIDGEKLVLEACKANRAEAVFVSEDYCLERKYSVPTYRISNDMFKILSPSKSPQGILCSASIPKYSLNMFLSLLQGDKNILLIDNVQDPGNLGNIIRTAYASGFWGLIILKGASDMFSSKVIRGSAGTCFDMPYIVVNDVKSGIEICRKLNKKLISADMSGDILYHQIEIENSVCIAIGSEGKGISKEILNSSDIVTKVPMRQGIESLNVSVVAALLMYQFVRRT